MGNKHDLEKQRQVSQLEIDQFCETMKCEYIPCSVLEDCGFPELIERTIAKSLELERLLEGEDTPGGDNNEATNRNSIGNKGKGFALTKEIPGESTNVMEI